MTTDVARATGLFPIDEQGKMIPFLFILGQHYRIFKEFAPKWPLLKTDLEYSDCLLDFLDFDEQNSRCVEAIILCLFYPVGLPDVWFMIPSTLLTNQI